MSRLLFTKEGPAVYASHLDLMRTMRRALLRAGLPVKHSEGFNPHANITIAVPLPLGHSSCCELMDFTLQDPSAAGDAVDRLNAALPTGVRALEFYEGERAFKHIEYIRYNMELIYDNAAELDIDALEKLFAQKEIVIYKKSKKTEGDFDIAPCIKEIRFEKAGDNKVICQPVLTAARPMLNPQYLIAAIKKYLPGMTPDHTRYSRLEVYDAQMQVFR